MEVSIINKYTVKKNEFMKRAQKEAKKYYGITFGKAPKAKINKVVSIHTSSLIASTEKALEKKTKEKTATYDVESVIKRLRDVKLTGLSGDGFLTADKIKIFCDAKAEKRYLIINAVECDPGLVHDGWLLRHKLGEIKKGIEVLRNCFLFEKVVLASKMKLMVEDDDFEVKKVPNRYPMGYEKFLIQNILGKKISMGEVPAKEGILVLNVQTILAIGQIVLKDARADTRYLTVANTRAGKAVVVQAKLGSTVQDVIEAAFPNGEKCDIYTGCGAMLCHKASHGETVQLTTNFIGYGDDIDYNDAESCKHCGSCVSKCPTGVRVDKIVQAVEKGNSASCSGFHADCCVGCGTCTYVCSAQKDVRAIVTEIKNTLHR